MEREILTGRTIDRNKCLTCYLATIDKIEKDPYSKMYYLLTDVGKFSLAWGSIRHSDFEVGTTYYFQTIETNRRDAKIEVIDFIKF